MIKRILGVFAIVSIVTMSLVGCKKGGEVKNSPENESSSMTNESSAGSEKEVKATVGDQEGTSLELWTFVDVHATFYQDMVTEWNKENPTRTINLTAITYPYDDMHNKMLMSLQAGTGAPDICDVEVGKFPNFVEGEDIWLYPMDQASKPYISDMVPSRMDMYKGEDNHYYGIPFHVGATVMYYNLAEIEKAGLTKDDIDAVVTWDDYAALGKKYLEGIGNVEGKYWTSVDTGGTDWLSLAMSEYGDDWSGGFNGKANVELESVSNMLKMQQDWLKTGLAQISPDGHVDLEVGYQNILDHNIVSFPKAMWYMSRFINYMPEEKGSWYMAKCPVFEKGQPCSVGIGGTGTVVTQESKNKKLAADFVCWAKMSPYGEKQIWKRLGFDVCNTTLWTDETFAHDESNIYNTFFINKPYDLLSTISDQIGKIASVSISPTINEQMCNITLNEVLEDGQDVSSALKEAQDVISQEQ